MKVVLVGAALALFAWGPPAWSDLPDTIERVKPSIVGIGTVLPTRRPPGNFVATGFVVGDGRHVLTNAHALPEDINDSRREHLAVITIGSKVLKAEVVAKDMDHDIALLRFQGSALPHLRLDAGRTIREGELYAFSGFPIGMVLGLYPVTHRGIIAAVTPVAIPQLSGRSLNSKMVRRLSAPYDVYQLDATAYPGNSGSPLYDPETGAVVAVINKVFVKETKENVLEKPSGITYAIPIRWGVALMKKAGVGD
ncbi:MAG: serine protease [Gammaproteobacteria bacterium]|nr:serine protease [Gammaproteobacteria bacterium]